MYSKCGSVADAREVFEKIYSRNVVSWTIIIGAYAGLGHGDEAFELFQQMQQEGVKPNAITFISILNAFSSPESLALGKFIHGNIIYSGFESDVVVGNALVSMYTKCGIIGDARKMFDQMPVRDVASWNAMIAGYVRHGNGEEAIKFFSQMQLESVNPNYITFLCILNTCVRPHTLAVGKLVHAHIIGCGTESDFVVSCALVSMYGRCSSIEDAQRIFDRMLQRDVVSWTALIDGYALQGFGEVAFKLFQQMQQEGVKPNKITFTKILGTCTIPGDLPLGKLIHGQIIDCGYASDIVVGNAIISMYGRCGSIEDAWRMFGNMAGRNIVTWNAMITACAQYGNAKASLELFEQMQGDGVKPDRVTFMSILDACSSLGALVWGRQVHAYIIDRGIESGIDVSNALMSVYGRCGSIEDAYRMFSKMPKHDMISWNAMIGAYAQNGNSREALQLFQEMQIEGVSIDEITLVSVLNACSRAGLVDEGYYYFNSMRQDFDITPTIQHCNCMVDLLGRAGRLGEAEYFIYSMPCVPNAVTWMTLLASCRAHGCVEQGKRAAECAIQLLPQLAQAYVVLSNIYAAAGRWD
eukprot:c24584_g8_i1 orf=540-2285(+)